MANARGGYVVLGVREKKGNFIVEGISDIATVTKQLFDIANNKKKVNVNLLTDQSVQVINLELLELSTVSLVSQEVTERLDDLFGQRFHLLDDLERMIVITAATEGWVNHERACQLASRHSRDVTLAFPKLVDKGFLIASGEKRDKSYSLPGMELPSPEEVFANALSSTSNLTHSAQGLTHSDPDLVDSHQGRDEHGRFISHLLDKPFIDDLDVLSDGFRDVLEVLAAPSREHRRLEAEVMKELLVQLCDGHYLSVAVMEILLGRKAQSIRQNYLKPMVDSKQLKLAFPDKPNSPRQGYTLA